MGFVGWRSLPLGCCSYGCFSAVSVAGDAFVGGVPGAFLWGADRLFIDDRGEDDRDGGDGDEAEG